MDSGELRDMVLDYMDRGFLENIIDMFKHDEGLFPMVVDMLKDERIMVRLGGVALIEDFALTHRGNLVRLIPALGSLLRDVSPTVRGDGAYVLGIIGHADALPFLTGTTEEPNETVRLIIRESIADIAAAQQKDSLGLLGARGIESFLK